jgi:hypothetical protein
MMRHGQGAYASSPCLDITLPTPYMVGVSKFGDNLYEGDWQDDQMHGHGALPHGSPLRVSHDRLSSEPVPPTYPTHTFTGVQRFASGATYDVRNAPLNRP